MPSVVLLPLVVSKSKRETTENVLIKSAAERASNLIDIDADMVRRAMNCSINQASDAMISAQIAVE